MKLRRMRRKRLPGSYSTWLAREGIRRELRTSKLEITQKKRIILMMPILMRSRSYLTKKTELTSRQLKMRMSIWPPGSIG